jgi:hypothetical protein
VQPPDPAKAPPDLAAPPPATAGTARAGSPPLRARAVVPAPTLRARGKGGPAAAFLTSARDPGGPLRWRRGGGRGRWWRRLGFRGRRPVTHAGETSRPPVLTCLVSSRSNENYVQPNLLRIKHATSLKNLAHICQVIDRDSTIW